MNALRAWYSRLGARDRQMLLVGGVAAGALLLIGGVLMPLHFAVENARSKAQAKRDDLVWIQRNAREIRAAGDTIATPSNESPIVLVDRTGRDVGLANALRGTAPNGAGGVRVQLESASFDTLVAWLGDLDSRYGLSVESITIDRAARPGAVNASLSLTTPHR